MPYAMCPSCGQTMHLSVGDVRDWYERFHPNLPVGSLVPAVCYYCWPELKAGDAIGVRKVLADNPGVEPGVSGVIQDVVASDAGCLFLVKLDSGKQVYLTRAQLRKLREGERKPDPITD